MAKWPVKHFNLPPDKPLVLDAERRMIGIEKPAHKLPENFTMVVGYGPEQALTAVEIKAENGRVKELYALQNPFYVNTCRKEYDPINDRTILICGP